MIEPYPKGGKIGLFGGAGVGKTVVIMELINNIAKVRGVNGAALRAGRRGLLGGLCLGSLEPQTSLPQSCRRFMAALRSLSIWVAAAGLSSVHHKELATSTPFLPPPPPMCIAHVHNPTPSFRRTVASPSSAVLASALARATICTTR